MNYRVIILYLLTVVSITSCSSLRKSVNNKDRVVLNHSNFKLINGKYSVKAIDNKGSFDLTSCFFNNNYKYIFSDYSCSDSLCSVQLEVLDEKTLNISYVTEKSTIKKRKVNGKLKDGYFLLKQSHLFLPLIFTNLYRNRQFRIGLLNNGNLITDHNMISLGSVLVIVPFYLNEKNFDVEFERMDD